MPSEWLNNKKQVFWLAKKTEDPCDWLNNLREAFWLAEKQGSFVIGWIYWEKPCYCLNTLIGRKKWSIVIGWLTWEKLCDWRINLREALRLVVSLLESDEAHPSLGDALEWVGQGSHRELGKQK